MSDQKANQGHGADHHDHAHSEFPFLAHHFDTPEAEFDAGKLGIWLFLVTEVLFFSGLFCAYAIYRSLHPEIFEWAHYYLDTTLGGINTCVLIVSSLTAAWAVRNAQLAQHKALAVNIVITILCAFGFMGIKYMEYSHKFHDGLLPGRHFAPTEQVWELESYREHHPEAAEFAEKLHHAKESGEAGAVEEVLKTAPKHWEHGVFMEVPDHASVFFSIYFCMTGLHGIHVLGGIVVWVWILRRALRQEFGPNNFGAVDFAALYWHLVDLIWIYLFPLLYLIH